MPRRDSRPRQLSRRQPADWPERRALRLAFSRHDQGIRPGISALRHRRREKARMDNPKRRLSRRARSKLRNSRRDLFLSHNRRRSRRHVHGSRGYRRASQRNSRPRNLLCNQHGRGHHRRAVESGRSAGDRRAHQVAIHRAASWGDPKNVGGHSVSEYDHLIVAAKQARENAHAPYSNFRVGAALRATSGRIFGGCNVENATYGLTVCAERVAIFKAISEGERGFDAIAVVTDTDALTSPCGACRQLIWEFWASVSVTTANLKGKTETIQMKDLFPTPCDSSNLDEGNAGMKNPGATFNTIPPD